MTLFVTRLFTSNSGQRLDVTVAGDEGSARLDRVLAVRARELSRSRLKALILAGQVTVGSAPHPRPRLSCHRRRYDHNRRAGSDRRRAQGRGYRARYRLRGRRHHRHRQAERASSCIPPPGIETGTLVNALIAHCGDQPLRHRRRQAAGHRAPARQGHHRADGGGEERPRASVADRAIRRSRPHRRDAARLYGVRLGRARPPARHGRRADRPPSAIAREKMAVRARAAARRHPLGNSGKPSTDATASRSPPCSPASWRPAAPIRSGCISPISVIP